MDFNFQTILKKLFKYKQMGCCKLNYIFDKIYVIHCAENIERMNNINYQIKTSNIDLEIFWTCYHPHSYICANALTLANKGRAFENASEFNLTRNFYNIIKTSYLRGFNHILIFEDDFSLLKSDILDEYLNYIPEDFDIIQFSLLFKKDMYDVNKLIQEYDNDKYFIKAPFGAWSNNGLALSRNGMKYFIDKIDKEFLAADYVAFESANKYDLFGKTIPSNLNHYFPTIPLVYLDKRFDSQVQQEDKKELYMMYDMLDKSFYNLLYENNHNKLI